MWRVVGNREMRSENAIVDSISKAIINAPIDKVVRVGHSRATAVCAS
jgi:carbonic anhydrase